ncbi:hypothetical protein CHS0354_014561 [Potamilus streckersoni]|uniref:CCHC-type domain-containing protein n=1 Tax=Potamilus streckersoni TaxID=2493646 RepID=A0AAE0VGZ0_9BIVA|nr:hypothetical protein CHS0354_014561 [Potamilus streckersoni]
MIQEGDSHQNHYDQQTSPNYGIALAPNTTIRPYSHDRFFITTARSCCFCPTAIYSSPVTIYTLLTTSILVPVIHTPFEYGSFDSRQTTTDNSSMYFKQTIPKYKYQASSYSLPKANVLNAFPFYLQEHAKQAKYFSSSISKPRSNYRHEKPHDAYYHSQLHSRFQTFCLGCGGLCISRRVCRASNKQCYFCHKTGHFSRVCFSLQQQNEFVPNQGTKSCYKRTAQPRVNLVAPIHKNLIPIYVRDKVTHALVDSGANISAINGKFLYRLGLNSCHYKPSNISHIVGAGGENHTITGLVQLKIENRRPILLPFILCCTCIT